MGIYSKDWNYCCDTIDKLEEIGDEYILCECVRMLCANSNEAQGLVINAYGDIDD